MSESKPETRTPIRMLYIGVEKGAKTLRVYKWVKLHNISNDGSSLPKSALQTAPCYNANSKKRGAGANLAAATIGDIYQFDSADDGSIFNKSGKFIELWKNKDDIVEWQTAHRAEDLAIDEIVAENKHKKLFTDYDLKQLEPIRTAYRKANWRNKTLILSSVIRYITNQHE